MAPKSSIGWPLTCGNGSRTRGATLHAISSTCALSPRPGRTRRLCKRSVAQLPWRHQIALLEKLNGPELRLWYAAQAVEQGWSRDFLAHQITMRFHERAGKAITNFAATMPPADSDLAQQATRDPYLFDLRWQCGHPAGAGPGAGAGRPCRQVPAGARPWIRVRRPASSAGDRRRRVLLRPAVLPPEAPLLRRHRTEGR